MLSFYFTLLETETEKEEFELLYQTYRKLMHWVADSILQDKALAEDAVHEAFLRIIKNFHKINGILCPETKSYVVIIVRNVALSMREKEKRNATGRTFSYDQKNYNGEQPDDELYDILANLSYGYDETADEICRKEIMNAILSLSDTLKEVLLLYGYFGYSIREIAISLHITEDVAYKRLQRARRKLAQKLERGQDE